MIEQRKIVLSKKTRWLNKKLGKLIAEQKLIQWQLEKDNDWVLKGPRGSELP